MKEEQNKLCFITSKLKFKCLKEVKRMSFKMFIPTRIPTGKEKISILKSGNFWVNRKTDERFFKGFKRVLLYWDKERKIIGFKPVNDGEHSYSLNRAKKRRDISISGSAFLKYTGINYKNTQNFEPIWDDKEKLVTIQLK